jgi:nucleoside-diphosphate-sugar epimerase
MLSLDNLIDFIVLTAHDPRAGNQTFLLSDGEDMSSKDLVNEIAKALGLRPRLIPVPIFILIALGFLTGRSAVIQRLLGSLQIDSSKATKLLNWTPPVTVEEGMARTIKAFLIDGK